MRRTGQFRVWPRLGFRGWASVILALFTVIAIMFAVSLIALTVLFFAVPALALVALFYYFFPPRRRRPPQAQPPSVIEGNFRVVDSPEGAADRERDR